MISRRRLLGLAGAGAAAALLPGCTGEDPDEVSWQAIPSYSLQVPDPVRAAYLRTQLARFQRSAALPIAPVVASADDTAAMAKLLLQASQHRAPDVSQVDVCVFGRMAALAQPLTRQLAAANLHLEDWIPSLRPVMTGGGGEVRALQFTTDVRVLYYRRDLVARPPASWDELVSIATPLAKAGYVVLFPGGVSEGAVTTSLWPQLWSQGGELFDAEGRPAFTSGAGYAAMLASLGVIERLVSAGVSPTRVATFGSEDDADPDIVAGRVAMFLGGSWQAAALDNVLPDKDFFTTWGVAPIPTISGQHHVTSAGGWVWAGFTGEPAHLDVGMDWVIQAFVGDAGMAAWCTAGGYLPPRMSVYDHPAYRHNPFTPIFRDHLTDYARTRPGDRGYLDVSNTMQVALSSVASGAVTARQALDAALDRLVS